MNPRLLEWLFAREVARRLGFTPDELYFAVSPSGRVLDVATGMVSEYQQPIIGLQICRDGITFGWTIGPIDLPLDKIQGAYEAACAAWNRGEIASHEAFLVSRPCRQAVQLMTALRAKGLRLNDNPF
jgi:hypothetical protein